MLLTRFIYPLSLRERISSRLRNVVSPASGKNVSLLFSDSIQLDLSHKDVGHQSLILNGFVELDLTKRIKKLAEQGGLLVDVGANYGYFSCLWAGEKPTNRSLAFEASPLNVPAIQNNITKNNLTNRVKLESVALGREIGTLNFTLENSEGQTGWGGFTLEGSSTSVEVSVDTLDNYAETHGIDEIDVLKIDVEGADTWVLLGAAQLIREKRIKHLFFEANQSRMALLGIAPDEAENFLTQHGYVVERMSDDAYYAYVPDSI